MIHLLAISALLLSACGGGAKSTTTGPQQNASGETHGDTTGGAGQPSMDPTLPSWVPESCVAYHKVAIEAMGCTAIEQSKRDAIQQEYGAASQGWKAEPNADGARVEEIAAACVRSSNAVHADIAGKCAEAK
ncbi:MAG TPA: hypothetical protein VMZ53_30950 [Kofleriaceae bacterium]|nr:hypothetical protein [Kofleriaceae bacterium]